MQEVLSCFFKDMNDFGSQQIGKYVLKTLTPFCQCARVKGDSMQQSPLGGMHGRYLGSFWVMFQTLITFLGQTASLVCACHCCFCSAWVYSLAFHFNSCPGTSVLGWYLCCRAEALSRSCLLAALPQGHRVLGDHHGGQKAKSCK